MSSRCSKYLYLVGTTVLAILAAPSNAQEPTTPRTPRSVQEYAKAYNVTEAEAARRIKLQREIGEIGAKIEAQEGAIFGGMYIEHRPTFRVVTKFTANGEATLRRYTQDPTFVAVTAAHTYGQLKSTQDSLLALLKPLNIQSWTDLDLVSGRVKLYVPDPAVVSLAVTAGTLKLPDLVDVVKAADTNPQREATIEGGRPLNGGSCTTGFTVRPTSSTSTARYMLTAGHCTSPITYNGVTLTRVGINYNVNTAYDYQWLSTTGFDRPTNWIYDGIPGYYLEITGIMPYEYMSLGAYVCKYGSATGYNCGNIASKDYKPTGSPNAFVRVHHPDNFNMSASGDSGGPYYDDYNYQAYGIHNDSAKFVNPNDSAFMPVSYTSASSLQVLIQP
jgi:hypothetical protein